MAATDELTADGDQVIVFRLKHPFPLLPAALGKNTPYMPAIMPERLALTDADDAGAGDGRFRPVPLRSGERVPGSLVVYRKFEGYKPREGGVPPIGPPARRSCISTAWSGTPRPTRPPPPPRCNRARPIGGTTPPRTCCRCCASPAA